jgi:NADPH-dependent 7-cyano-7-deazaguanine reductase QueF-like protein
MKNDLIVLMPDGVGIRNYLYADVFKGKKQSPTILHNFKEDTVQKLEISKEFKAEKLIDYKETPKEKFFRELIHLTRLQYNAKLKQNSSILSNYRPKKNSFKLKLFYLTVETLAKAYNSLNQIEKLENKYNKAIRHSKVYKLYFNYFKTNTFNTIFCTHQRAVIAAPIFAAAKDAGLKTITAIYSWDNLPKARLALKADEYIVWSPYMKKELKTYYPDIQNHQIKILGTPQFQFHYDKSLLWSKEKFANYYQLDLNKKWICFSGDDKTTSPYDQDYLEDIAHQLSQSGLNREWQVLLRPVPVEGFEKYQPIIDKYPDIIKKTGAVWEMSSHWSDVYPHKKDLNVLSSLCEYAEGVINVGSTMGLDFGMHNKPAIYINYDTQENSNWTTKRIYQFQHFKTMKDLNPVIWLNSPDELPDILTKLQLHYKQTQQDMKSWCDKIIPENLRQNSSQLIRKALIS